MAKSHFSHHWYRAAKLKPSLRNHVEIHRQVMRGKIWFVIQDVQSGKYFRISPATYAIVMRLDGVATIDTIWQEEGKKLGKSQPTQDEIIELLAHLYRADLLRGDVPVHMSEFVSRSDRSSREKILSRIANPMAMRFPLVDPDKFLEKILPLFRPVFTRLGMIAWVITILFAAVLVVMNWGPLTSNLSDRVLSANNILFLLVLYPIIKSIHEIGHGLAVKVYGGEVHEMGIMLLIFMPVPYVDASASSAFKSRWQRAVVGGAGVMVESLLAATALFIWLEAEPGVFRTIAFNVMLLGGVSTVLFNGNPLLRFDGYYVLSDILNIPNLGTRANRYLTYLLKKFAFGLKEIESPAHSAGEARWFIFYGIAAFAYRMFIMINIALFVATKFFFIGVLLAGLALYNTIFKPIFKGIADLKSSPALGVKRGRAQRVTLAGVLVVVTLLFVVPAPHSTDAEGVLYLEENVQIISRASGFMGKFEAKPGSFVAAGEVLFELEDEALDARIRLLGAQVKELKASYDAVNLIDRVQADILTEQLARAEGSLSFYQKRQGNLSIKAQIDGTFILPSFEDIQGRFINEGQVIGYVMPSKPREVRVVVPQDRAALVSTDTNKIEVRVEGDLFKVITAEINRETPSAISQLPSSILSVGGGGRVAVNPQSSGQLEPLSLHYQFDLLLDQPVGRPYVNGRIFAHFIHSREPLGIQWLRTARQIFLSILNV